MTSHRWYPGCAVLLAAFCGGCDGQDSFEPVPPTSFAGNGEVKVNPPSNPKAVATSYAQIEFSWQDNSNNETGFEVQRSTTGASGPFSELAVTERDAAAYYDGGLTPSTAYCYQVRAFRIIGSKRTYSAFTSAACATTQAPPVPTAPSGLEAASRFSGYTVFVTWTDNSTNETGFRVERSATIDGPWTTVGTTRVNITSLEASQSPNGEQPICYRVLALNTFGDSDPSNVDCVIVPAAPGNLTATVLADGSVDLTWTDNTALEDGYEVQRGGGGAEGMTVIKTLPTNATSYRDAGLSDSSYGYSVRATRDGATSPNSNFVQVVVATRPPDTPANVDATPAGSSAVTVTWLDLAMNEEGSRVERSTDGGASWTAAGTVGWYRPYQPPWFWDEARAEQQVCYRVITFNRIGDSPPSNTDCTTPPAAPTDFTATAVGSEAVDFTWTDNSAVEEGHYVVLDYGYGYWETIAWAEPNTTSFRLEGYPDQYAIYYVAATKDGGYSDFSNGASPISQASSNTLHTVSRARGSALQGLPPGRLLRKAR